ncbi:MAG: hypothetical protein AAF657_34830, partial [Acidobacteriota bacterium]
MVSIAALWMPIVVSAIFVFFASSIIHMVIKFHNSDYGQLPGEDKIAAAMREEGVKPGFYIMPYCLDPNEAAKPETRKKYEDGPVGLFTVAPSGPPAMGKQLGLWFAFCLVVGVFCAYMAGRLAGPDADYLAVFRITGTTAFLAYGASEPIASIWKYQPWSNT